MKCETCGGKGYVKRHPTDRHGDICLDCCDASTFKALTGEVRRKKFPPRRAGNKPVQRPGAARLGPSPEPDWREAAKANDLLGGEDWWSKADRKNKQRNEARMKLRSERNEYGTAVSVHRCLTCGEEFTICPESDAPWDRCQMEPCPTYDPTNDLNLFFDVLAENGLVERAPVPPEDQT